MSTIAAGTTSGTALVSTGNTDGTLQLQVNGTTPSVTLAANGSIGVGSTPGYGTNGQVLTSSGTGSAPTWVTPTPGALTLLSTVTASNSATVDLETTFSSTYDVYIIQATGVTMATNNVGLYCRFKIGGSYVGSGTPYSYAADHTGQADTSYQINRSTAADQIEVVASGDIGNASTEYTTFEMRIDQVASTALYKTVTWVGMSLDTGGVYLNQRGGGRITNAGALTGIRFLSTSGNIAAGKFRLYGLANS